MEKLPLQVLSETEFPVYPKVPPGKPSFMVYRNYLPFMSGTMAPFVATGHIRFGPNLPAHSMKCEATTEREANSYIPLIKKWLLAKTPPRK